MPKFKILLVTFKWMPKKFIKVFKFSKVKSKSGFTSLISLQNGWILKSVGHLWNISSRKLK